MDEQNIPTIDVVPVATISINELGIWFLEVVAIGEDGKPTSIVRTSMNLTHLFNQVRTGLHKNKDYFEAVAKRAAEVKRIKSMAEKNEVKTEE